MKKTETICHALILIVMIAMIFLMAKSGATPERQGWIYWFSVSVAIWDIAIMSHWLAKKTMP